MQDVKSLHAMCAVCGSEEGNLYSLGVAFSEQIDHVSNGKFTVLPRHQGYSGLLHGGIASSLLDAAMTHCLLSQNIPALTAQLDVRFHHPIKVGEQIDITGQCVTVKRGIYCLSAQLVVGGEVRVTASGKFLRSNLAEGANAIT